MKTGVATVPLDWGHCPPWLFLRMKQLAQGIAIAISEEFGPQEMLKRLSDPVWFQSFGCVLGFDWNSSGLTVTTMGALKEAVRGIERDVGLYVCGGKKVSRNTPMEAQAWGQRLGWNEDETFKLVNASRMAAKVDSALVQDGFQIYAHNLVFTADGKWSVIQQGMNVSVQKARRYHWLSDKVSDFCETPHSGIASDQRLSHLNLTAKESRENKTISADLVKEEPKTFLKDFLKLADKADGLTRQRRLPGFTEMELNNVEFHWHPVAVEKFNVKRLKKTIEKAHFFKPKDFSELLKTEGVGPKTIRALSLVSEVIYGAKPSYEDPARYTFAVGGKDGTPYPVDRSTYDKTIDIIEKGIRNSKITQRERSEAQARLSRTIRK
jgi:hypothetical protein